MLRVILIYFQAAPIKLHNQNSKPKGSIHRAEIKKGRTVSPSCLFKSQIENQRRSSARLSTISAFFLS